MAQVDATAVWESVAVSHYGTSVHAASDVAPDWRFICSRISRKNMLSFLKPGTSEFARLLAMASWRVDLGNMPDADINSPSIILHTHR